MLHLKSITTKTEVRYFSPKKSYSFCVCHQCSKFYESEISAGNENFDLLHSFITTIVFKNDGEIITARSRNFGMGGVDPQQDWSGFEKNGSTYSMLNGEHYDGAKEDYSDARWFEDRKISGLQRSNDFTSRQGIDVINGSDCGKNLNNLTKECLSTSDKL